MQFFSSAWNIMKFAPGRTLSRVFRHCGPIAVLLVFLLFLHPLVHADAEDHPACPLCTGAVSIHFPIPLAALISFLSLLFVIAHFCEDCIAIHDPSGFYCKRAPPQSLLFS